MGPKKFTNTKWNINLAYAIGLLVTDGNLSPDGRHINFTSKDKELAELFKNCLSLNNKIGKKGNGLNKEKKYYVVQFGDVTFYDWCLGLGIMPNKSKIISSIKVPDKYFFDFLRGCFDGDGCSYAYWDKRWHSSYMFYFSICSASSSFLKWLQQKTKQYVDVIGKISAAKGVYQLRFAKRESILLFNKMYYKNNLPFLKRKHLKMRQFIKVDKRHAEVAKLVHAHA